jgi:hypothetical protein
MGDRVTGVGGSRIGLLWIGGILIDVSIWLTLPWKFSLLTTGLLLMGLAVLSGLLSKWSLQG